MVLRGVIASYAPEGSGTVVVGGNPYPFTLERMWQSPVLPAVGMPVDVAFSPEVGIASIVAAESQPASPPSPRPNPVPLDIEGLKTIAHRPLDLADLAAVFLLLLSWFVLPVVVVNLFFLGVLKITFWQILGHYDTLGQIGALESGSARGLLLRLLALLSLPAALAPLLVRMRALRLAALAPLAVMALVGTLVWAELHRAAKLAGSLVGGEFAAGLANQAAKMIHLGLGAWIGLLAALWLAVNAIRKFAADSK